MPKKFEFFFMLCVLCNMFLVVIGTLPALRPYESAFDLADWVFVAIFAVEYAWRMACAPHTDARFAGWRGRLRYALTPMALVDAAALLPALFLWSDATALRSIRLLSVFRLFKMMRYELAAHRLRRAIWSRREELVIVLSVLGIFMLIAAVAMYALEREAQPAIFSSIPAALWWAVITVTTIGYGDIVPVTAAGKVVSSVCAFVGVLLIALPTSIVAGAFIDQTAKPK